MDGDGCVADEGGVSTKPAERLFRAEAAFLRAWHEIDALVCAIYEQVQDFEVDPDGTLIQVYGVTPAPCAVDVLRRAGFRHVIEHEHTSREFRKCGCRRTP